ncbi:hypothetical protein PG990_012843 [Apiospora arundinis]|uniref:Ubiquitin-protein ligase Sel1 n=1 Tax=Apiospora arundinis TaxID=335852 RepID=A0ABR2HRP0_9PEZI
MGVITMPRPRVGTVMIDAFKLAARANNNDDLPPGWVREPNGRVIPFWHTKTGIIIRWSIFAGLLFITLTWIFVGRWHARKRVSKGLAPMAYHRWLIPRSELAKSDPRYKYPDNVQYMQYPPPPPGAYGMQPMPPQYQPGPLPPGYAKDDTVQGVTHRPGEEYPPPPGPPPPVATRPGQDPFADPPRR